MVSLIGICLVLALWVSFLLHERNRAALALLDQYVAIARDFGFKLESVDSGPEGRPERKLQLTEGKTLYLTLRLTAWTGRICASFASCEPALHQTMHFRRHSLEPVNVWLLQDVVGEWRTWRDLVHEWQDLKARRIAPPRPMRAMIASLSSGNLADAWAVHRPNLGADALILLVCAPLPIMGISTAIG